MRVKKIINNFSIRCNLLFFVFVLGNINPKIITNHQSKTQ